VDPTKLPDTVVTYVDSTVAMPIITSYALAKRKPRTPKRLYLRLPLLMHSLKKEHDKARHKKK